jgi:branched-chain amino acid transport system substrate-binding protein
LDAKAIRILAVLVAIASPTLGPAQKLYDPGATDTEIKIGNIMTYTGWQQAYGAIGRAEAAYFQMINDRGGIHGRKIMFISLDNASDAARSLPLAQKLVEQDGVLLLFSPQGTETNLRLRAYLNDKKVPQLFVDTSSAAFDDPSHFPWTTGFFATYRAEALAYAKYVLETKHGAKVAILYADDEAGREYLAGAHEGFGDKASTVIVNETSYETSDANLDLQLTTLKNAGADVFFNFSIGPFATQSIRKAYDIDWRPLEFIPNASLSTAAFLDPAGLEKARGIISNARSKGWLMKEAQGDADVREFLEWMRDYNPQASLRDENNVAGYERAEALVEVLRKCGDDLTRANIMKQAAHLNLVLPMLRPGISFKTAPDDLQPIHQLFLVKFDGRGWVPFGAVIDDSKLSD